MSAVTYTLTADCTQTGELTGSGVAITINGAGFTIQPSATFPDFSLITLTPDDTLNLNLVTIDGLDISIATLISTSQATFVANNVTFRGGNGAILNVDGAATLTNVLFEDNSSRGFAAGGNASALNVSAFGGAVSITNAVFRDNYGGGGAISVNTAGSGSVTTKGCLTFSGNVPFNVFGDWTDNSSGPCSGTIGNGAQAVIAPPAVLPCGLPGAGNLDRSTRYTLRADCDLSGEGNVLWTISDGVNISIQGNGYRLSGGSGSDWRWIEQAGNGRLTLRNVVVDHVKTYAFGTLNIEDSIFRDTSDRMIFHLGRITIRNSIFENITTTRTGANASVLLVLPAYGSGHATISNSIFRNNTSGGAAVLSTWPGASSASTVTLNGCITFENNTTPNYGGNVTDNSAGACGPGVVIGTTGPVPPSTEPKCNPHCGIEINPSGICQTVEDLEAIPLGAIACLFRHRDLGRATVLSIYGVNDQSVGFHLLTVSQSQVDAATGEKVIAVSPDGRALLVKWPDDNVTVKVGPNIEDKIQHVTLEGGLFGRVLGYTTTYGPAPGLPYLTHSASSAQVSLGTSAAACYATTLAIVNLRDVPAGRVIVYVPWKARLTVLARKADWVQVDNHGVAGWISAEYVTLDGDCG